MASGYIPNMPSLGRVAQVVKCPAYSLPQAPRLSVTRFPSVGFETRHHHPQAHLLDHWMCGWGCTEGHWRLWLYCQLLCSQFRPVLHWSGHLPRRIKQQQKIIRMMYYFCIGKLGKRKSECSYQESNQRPSDY